MSENMDCTCGLDEMGATHPDINPAPDCPVHGVGPEEEEIHGYEYISISWSGFSSSGKTSIYSVTNNRSGHTLGIVKWHGPWRQYVFQPTGWSTVYSAGCLADIQTFIEETMAARVPKG